MCLYLVIAGKVWPVAFGAGLGLGIGYANCQNDIQSPYLLRSKKIVVCIRTSAKGVY